MSHLIQSIWIENTPDKKLEEFKLITFESGGTLSASIDIPMADRSRASIVFNSIEAIDAFIEALNKARTIF